MIRSLEKEKKDSNIPIRRKIEHPQKTLEYLKLDSYKKKMLSLDDKEKQERRRKEDDKEREVKTKEPNGPENIYDKFNEYNSRIERKLPYDQDQMKQREEQIIINNLKEEIEKRDQMLKVLNESLKNTQNTVKNVEDPYILINKMEERLSEQEKQLKEALSKLREKEATLEDIKLDLEKKSRENMETIKELKSENNKINQRKQVLENDIKLRDLELNAFGKQAKVDASVQEEIGNIVREKDIQLANLEDQIQRSLTRLKETEIELEQTKTRLSKAMGDRLMDNNPNIADLSDENRPVKLAERYSELYDNQWTDAFDFLSKSLDSEQRTIEALLEILQDITYFCITSASKQLDDIQGTLAFSSTSVGDIPVDVRLQLKNFRKALSKTAMRNLFESYISHMKQTAPDTLRTAPEVRPYVQECFEICWLMSIQDPPVVFAPVAKQGSILDTNIYKHYTSSGTHVEYTVWPAMLLHEKGPILAKGVAQGHKYSG